MDYLLFQKINPVKDFFTFLTSLDINIFNGVNSLAGQWAYLDVAGIFFAKYLGYIIIGAGLLLFCLPALPAGQAGGRQGKKFKVILSAFLAAITARFGIVELIRWLWERPRPFVENHVNLLLDKASEPSFPSGHAAFYFAIATVIYFYNKKLGIIFFTASVLMGLSRIFGGVHWPSDILAGALVGIFSGWLVARIFK